MKLTGAADGETYLSSLRPAKADHAGGGPRVIARGPVRAIVEQPLAGKAGLKAALRHTVYTVLPAVACRLVFTNTADEPRQLPKYLSKKDVFHADLGEILMRDVRLTGGPVIVIPPKKRAYALDLWKALPPHLRRLTAIGASLEEIKDDPDGWLEPTPFPLLVRLSHNVTGHPELSCLEWPFKKYPGSWGSPAPSGCSPRPSRYATCSSPENTGGSSARSPGDRALGSTISCPGPTPVSTSCSRPTATISCPS